MAGDERIGVGVLGGSGYIGAELLRYLVVHPRVEIRWVTAHARSGEKVADVLPNLRGFVGGGFIEIEEAEARIGEVRAIFLALPHNQSQDVIPRIAERHPDLVIIDMAGDFRTDDSAGYERFYGKKHAAPQWLPRFVYGFTELERPALRGARLIANPGCFATGLLLALAPLAKAGRLSGDICVTAVTGSSGSGNKPSAATHHPERASNFRSYKVLVHQHRLEVEHYLRKIAASEFRLHFVPQSAPLVRGIFVTVFLPGTSAGDLRRIFDDAYGGEPLIAVVDGSPELRWIQGTPRSFVGIAGTGGDGVVFTVTDNLGKGAAGQAIQNLNCALGFPETEGLDWPGGYV
ncbi:MAG: N-acetyl-gamma-glutamyl-phosphate reductase [Planctomycetes bacterium]|nr:N-acetyl-gamma-glutamyl-phosphate reductase [Planctomycetota bacterium]